MSTKPEPDGYVTIAFNQPLHSQPLELGAGVGQSVHRQRWTFAFAFANMRHWESDDLGVSIQARDNSSRTFYPWSAIQSLTVKYNSEAYRKLLRRYQSQHEHNWVETDKHPLDPNPQVIEHCEPNKTGTDEGCNAYRIDGVVQYG